MDNRLKMLAELSSLAVFLEGYKNFDVPPYRFEMDAPATPAVIVKFYFTGSYRVFPKELRKRLEEKGYVLEDITSKVVVFQNRIK